MTLSQSGTQSICLELIVSVSSEPRALHVVHLLLHSISLHLRTLSHNFLLSNTTKTVKQAQGNTLANIRTKMYIMWPTSVFPLMFSS